MQPQQKQQTKKVEFKFNLNLRRLMVWILILFLFLPGLVKFILGSSRNKTRKDRGGSNQRTRTNLAISQR
ncbi:MAG: hypothetical protein UW41_C0015G0004 [Candidatus Collierbacteria bacterium GW2011_GWC2_44_18]|uniref:Uncharacterized protein n=1 Tax=Candidatus Collierbacteria bacterium GW2011_GWC2_44_18 TaxID=1618392 RepID=A0A0G1JYD6_9BACT|nr:MAG: hypothetical protein UW41_C0015G0004 [Candidatus Collierbacteria bacterium GW2011_GWC2_44_18]